MEGGREEGKKGRREGGREARESGRQGKIRIIIKTLTQDCGGAGTRGLSTTARQCGTRHGERLLYTSS